MTRTLKTNLIWILLLGLTGTLHAEDRIELEITTIKGNKELPQILYLVPWKDDKEKKVHSIQHNLVLHSLFGDLFDPVTPEESLSYLETEPERGK